MRGNRLMGLVVVLGCAAAGVWLAAGGSPAQEKPELPDDLARVPGTALGFVSGRPGDLWAGPVGRAVRARLGKDLDAVTDQLEQRLGLEADDIERVTVVMEGPQEPLVLVRTKKAYDRKKLEASAPHGEKQKVPGGVLLSEGRQALGLASDRLFVVGPQEAVKAALAGKGAEGPLSAALAAAAGTHTGVLVINPAAVARAMPGGLPAAAAAFRPLFDAKLLTVTGDLGDSAAVKARLTFADAKAAKAAERPVLALLTLAGGGLEMMSQDLGKAEVNKGLVGLLKQIQEEMKEVTPRVNGSDLELGMTMKTDSGLLAAQAYEAILKVREAAARAQSANNLKQIVLALHNYHDANGQFPPRAVYGKDGKALLSWRVLILPYLEEAPIYKEFRLNEAWDSPHNKKLLAKMPKVYAHPVGKAAATFGTHYQPFVGKGTVFEGQRGIRLTDITDGTSNTLAVVEAGAAVPWTKPEDLEYDDGKPLPKLGGLFQSGFNAALCDGSVRFIKDTIDPKTLRLLITRADGMVIPGID